MDVKRMLGMGLASAALVVMTGCAVNKTVMQTATAKSGSPIVVKTATAEGEEAYKAGVNSALALKAKLAGKNPHIIIVTECYEEKAQKEQLIMGISTVFPQEIIMGVAAYGSYSQDGAGNMDKVTLMSLGGDGVSVSAALAENMGATGLSFEKNKAELTKALNSAGERLAKKLPGASSAKLILLIGDAHSPKNQLLMDGLQTVVGKNVPVTGGSVNKNAGQSYLYYRGAMYTDSAIAIALSGDFKVVQVGYQAKSNDKVIATARDAAKNALRKLGAKPVATFGFDCAGRMGKLKKLSDELNAIQSVLGNTTPIFGTYCAGEFGPADATGADSTSRGCGWHLMLTLIGQ